MNNNKIAFIYSVNDQKKVKESILTIKRLIVPAGIEIEIVPVKGVESITNAYNIGMNRTKAKYKVYLHPDVYILNRNLIRDILRLFQDYPNLGIIGSIGAKNIPLNGVWSESTNRYGKVYESSSGSNRLLCNQEVIGDYESVQAVDGLVMITQYDIPWREDIFKGFHFYDSSQCFEFLRAGYEVGVPKQQEPWFEHDCGIMDLNAFDDNRMLFLEHYGKDIQRYYIMNFDQYFSFQMEWFFEFIEGFKDLTYNGIPLALLIRFERYIDDNLYAYLIENCKDSKLKLEQIQPRLNRILDKIKERKPMIKKSNKKFQKKILIYNTPALRFPLNTLIEYYDPNTTIILELNRQGNYKGIAVHSLENYRKTKHFGKPRLKRHRESELLMDTFVNKAKEIFSEFSDHPLFSNLNFQNTFINEIPEIINYINSIENYFNSVPVSCVIVGQTGDLDVRTMALAAWLRGIPCICMQHGLIMGRLDTCYFPVFSKIQAVYGEFEREYYRSFGCLDKSTEIIGHPRFDFIFNNNYSDKKRILDVLGVDPKNKLVLIITTPEANFNVQPTYETSYYWNELVQDLVNNPNAEIIIKPTLYELDDPNLMKSYLELSSKFKSVKIMGSELQLYDVLPHVDVVAVESSTVGLEAMLFNKPVVCLSKDQPFWLNTFNYYGNLDCFYQTNPKKLVKIINELLEDKELQNYANIIRENFLKKSYPNKEELSAARLRNLVSKVINESVIKPIKGISDGMLIQAADGKVYLIENGMKRHIVSPYVFNKLGFDWKKIKVLNNTIIEQIPTGSLINITPDNT